MWSYSEFRLIVLVLCRLYPASETSGYRTIKHARSPQVGSTAVHSRHLFTNESGNFCGAKAVDLILDDPSDDNRESLCRAARELGLVALDEGDHIHIHDHP